MSCTVIALPYAIFMIVSSVAASIVAEASEKNIAFYEFLELKRVEKYGCCAFIR